MCFATAEYDYYMIFFIFDNYCMGPSVRQRIAIMVPSVYELISHIYFVSCIKYVHDWRINKYLSIYLSIYSALHIILWSFTGHIGAMVHS